MKGLASYANLFYVGRRLQLCALMALRPVSKSEEIPCVGRDGDDEPGVA
jgi:hypothetical protein